MCRRGTESYKWVLSGLSKLKDESIDYWTRIEESWFVWRTAPRRKKQMLMWCLLTILQNLMSSRKASEKKMLNTHFRCISISIINKKKTVTSVIQNVYNSVSSYSLIILTVLKIHIFSRENKNNSTLDILDCPAQDGFLYLPLRILASLKEFPNCKKNEWSSDRGIWIN